MPDLYALRPDGDPLVTIDDVADANEILLVRAENERRAYRASERRGGKS